MYACRCVARSLTAQSVQYHCHLRLSMSSARPTYATAASTAELEDDQHRDKAHQRASKPRTNPHESVQRKESPSNHHVPKTTSDEEATFVLTLLTDKDLHHKMTDLRKIYFPEHLNKLAAHLTLFHALPGSKLDEHILPIIKQVAADTPPFRIHAASPFRLKKGIAISVPRHEGGQVAQDVHQALQGPWIQAGFLSEQDAGSCRIHYTIMNKVDDEKQVAGAFEEVQAQWRHAQGTAEGLGLYRYEKGFWRWQRGFPFNSRS